MPRDKKIIQEVSHLLNEGRREDARELVSKGMKLHPDSIGLRRAKIRIDLSDKDYEDLARQYDELLKLDPSLIDIRVRRAELHGPEKLKEELDTSLEMAGHSKIQAKWCKHLLGGILRLGSPHDRNQALLRLLEVCERQPDRVQWLIHRASVRLALGDHAGFLSECDVITSKDVGSLKLARDLLNVAAKLRSPRFPDYEAPKVFCIGLSRTGTSSLNKALGLLGYHSVHWTNPITKGLLVNDDYLLFDSFTDITVSAHFEWLYHAFPNSKFIYTTRKPESWAESTSAHYNNRRKINGPRELIDPATMARMDWDSTHVEASLYAHHDTWEEAYLSHDKRVRAFFAEKDDSRFLEIAVTNGEGWEKLCPYLGHSVPAEDFPRTNRRPLQYRQES